VFPPPARLFAKYQSYEREFANENSVSEKKLILSNKKNWSKPEMAVYLVYLI
jgi:hypothetical protein